MKYTLAAGFILLGMIAWLLSNRPNEEKAKGVTTAIDRGVYHTTCASCHGERGQGKSEVNAPSIASLPRWYAEAQVKKFRNGQRGNHPDDFTGQSMRAAVIKLTDEQVSEALDTLDTFPAVDHAPTLVANLQRGAYLYRENCMECHRFNGRGEVAFLSSHIAGLQDWYLLAQWKKFKSGARGYHPDDEGGSKMRRAVELLENDSDAQDVILYISTLAKKYPEKKRGRAP